MLDWLWKNKKSTNIQVGRDINVGDDGKGGASTLIQAGEKVQITMSVSYEELDRRIHARRRGLAQEVLTKAQEMIREAGVQPGPVPMKTVVPLLEYASLEEDEYLREKWAAVLANAAVSSGKVHASFAEVLRQLTPQGVLFLDALFTLTEKRMAEFLSQPPQNQGGDPAKNLGMQHELLELFRKTVQIANADDVGSEFSIVLTNLRRSNIVEGPVLARTQVSFTAFGLEFIRSCRPPESKILETPTSEPGTTTA
jgi:Abortive infection alpha